MVRSEKMRSPQLACCLKILDALNELVASSGVLRPISPNCEPVRFFSFSFSGYSAFCKYGIVIVPVVASAGRTLGQ